MAVLNGIDRDSFVDTLEFFEGLGLVTKLEIAEVLDVLDPSFPFAEAVASAASIHLHIKVADVDDLPHDAIVARGTQPTSCTKGYIKYPFEGGINVIFSSIPIAEDDLLDGATPPIGAVLDHKGVDLRGSAAGIGNVFDAVPLVATGAGWRHQRQGGDGTPVYCCHTEVAAKHWVYPTAEAAGQSRPIEFALGELLIHDAKMGCDLRPIDPGDPRADEAHAALSACASSHAAPTNGTVGSSYYERGDLARFTEMGDHAGPTMAKFWAYYNAATGEDGALTKREKALIALAVAHSKQCPYCIDAYTNTLVDLGASPDEMHEAVHVAAALGAGIDLVHGVQMQNVLRSRGAI